MIPTIDVRKLNMQKRYSGDEHFTFEGDESLIDIPFVRFASPVRVDLHYEILEDDSVEVTGKLTYTLSGSCSRCLKETTTEVEWELDAYYVPTEPEEDEYSYRNGVIDLNDCLTDAVLFSMPPLMECGKDCIPLRWNEE